MPTKKEAITLTSISVPAKALVTCVVLFISLGMAGAMGQIIVHDIIPTFFSGESVKKTEPVESTENMEMELKAVGNRGDLFGDLKTITSDNELESEEGYDKEQLIWTLKWTHIHLFGINMIFIFMGCIALFLNVGTRLKTLLIVLPFVGVFIDIATMWLKVFVSPAFFWLHIPGGGLFGLIFVYVCMRALWEMWFAT